MIYAATKPSILRQAENLYSSGSGTYITLQRWYKFHLISTMSFASWNDHTNNKPDNRAAILLTLLSPYSHQTVGCCALRCVSSDVMKYLHPEWSGAKMPKGRRVVHHSFARKKKPRNFKWKSWQLQNENVMVCDCQDWRLMSERSWIEVLKFCASKFRIRVQHKRGDHRQLSQRTHFHTFRAIIQSRLIAFHAFCGMFTRATTARWEFSIRQRFATFLHERILMFKHKHHSVPAIANHISVFSACVLLSAICHCAKGDSNDH